MTIKPMAHKITGERFLSVDEELIPLGMASMCVDSRISGFEINCTECRTKYPVRLLNEGGYCEACVFADFEEAAQ
tara:strand:+ start:319 stop:543 length:225 start_codon:yes stop_codon:yes gene_type:complete